MYLTNYVTFEDFSIVVSTIKSLDEKYNNNQLYTSLSLIHLIN